MQRTEKERVVGELTERLRETESLLVADYRGLTNAQLSAVRSTLREHGATFTVVKNSLTRRAAEAAGAEQLLALLDGPTAIAFVQSGGDPVAVAKALSDTAKDTKVLVLRGGVLEGKKLEADDVERLAALPPVDVLKGQLVGVIVAPLTQLVGLVNAPLRDLVGLVDARITQLRERGEDVEASTEAAAVGQDDPAAGLQDEPAAAEEPGEKARATDDEPADGTASGTETTETSDTEETTETESQEG